MTTLADVWSSALVRVGLPSDDGYLDQETRRVLVNKAQRDVASEMDWPELQVEESFLTSTAPPYVLPAGEEFLRLLWIAIEGNLLLPRQRRELVRWDATPAVTGRPRYYALGGNGVGGLQLWVAPLPNSETYAVTYAYLRKPAPIYNDTDQLLVPDHLADAVVTRTAYLIAVRKNDGGMAGMMADEYKSEMATRRDEAVVVRGPAIPMVRQDWG